MRVLFLNPSGQLGGAERALIEVVQALREAQPDWQIGALSLEDGPAMAVLRGLGVEVMVLAPPQRFLSAGESGGTRIATALALAASAGPLFRYVTRFKRHLVEWRPDVVHSNGIKTHVLGAWTTPRHARLLWHVHDYISHRSISSHLLPLHRRRPALVLANSDSVADDLRSVLGPRTQVVRVYNAVDVQRFTPAGPIADLDAVCGLPAAPAGTVRIGLVATFARWKGHGIFLRAVASLPNRSAVRAYVIGGPVYQTSSSQVTRDELAGIAREAGLDAMDVGFSGFLPDPAGAYRALDVVVHASTSPEPFGLSIVEAMACGRAVVISEAGGAREIGEPGRTCLAHAPGDVPGLSAEIARLVFDPELRAQLGAAASAAVRKRFTRAVLGERLRAAYQSTDLRVVHA